MTVIDVAVGIIHNSVTNKVLVAQRNTKDMHLGKWEFPGGKINPGESAEQALKRELKEELGITVLSFNLFDSFEFDYTHSKVKLIFFMVTDFDGQAQGLQGQVVRWVNMRELSELDMLEANHLIISKIVKKLGKP